ncbi:signal peptidase I [Paenarthrobacter sp. NPDC090517]|uniref:signal peptidase I n=1 Tax=Paenarthrobacter sp. NPDC090517 TaxID=3364381 RepID=UPI0038055905
MLSLALIAVLPALAGWGGTVVQSGSMEPHISAGDVVLASALDPENPVPVGGVVEFTSPASAEPGGSEKTRLHRVVEANDDGTFVTAGDANVEADSTPLKREQITGQARLLVPVIGLPGLWLVSGNFPALTLWSALTLLSVTAAVFGGTRPDQHRQTGTGTGSDDDDDQTGTAPDHSAAREHFAALETRAAQPPGRRSKWQRAGAAFGLTAIIAVMVLAGTTAFSTAAFTATTATTANTFSASEDWNPPVVSINSPGSSLRGSVTLTATASDAETGVAGVRIEYAPSGGVWTLLCTASAPPYSCLWNTTVIPDGAYSLRAVATDKAGLITVSAPVETRVANTFAVDLADPGETQRGTVILSTTLENPSGGSYTVRVEYSAAGTDKWSTLCANVTSPYNCTWNTAAFTNGSYDLRAVAVSGGTATYSEIITDVTIDNQPPTVAMSDPGTPLNGTRTFTATATDTHSGIGQVQIQYSRSGTTTWSNLCGVDTEPFSCRYNTTALPNGTYSFRAVATDEAGNTTTSTAITNRIVDNTASSVSMEDPGAYLTGTVALTAAANSTAGVNQVRIQTAPAGTTAWTTRCSLATSPFTCNWDTRAVPDGVYDFRAILTDGTGRETTSSVITSRRVDNSPLRGADIQAANATGTAGRLGSADTLTYTYSQPVNLATITPGWTGAPLPVTLRLRDGNLLGLGSSGDTIDIQRNGSPVNLGTVNTKANLIASYRTATINATMTATTITTSGIPRTVITVTLGSTASGNSNLRTSTTSAAMVWTPTSSVTTPGGVRSSTAPTTETSPLDRDF